MPCDAVKAAVVGAGMGEGGGSGGGLQWSEEKALNISTVRYTARGSPLWQLLMLVRISSEVYVPRASPYKNVTMHPEQRQPSRSEDDYAFTQTSTGIP